MIIGAELLPSLILLQLSNWMEMKVGFSSQVISLGEMIDIFWIYLPNNSFTIRHFVTIVTVISRLLLSHKPAILSLPIKVLSHNIIVTKCP